MDIIKKKLDLEKELAKIERAKELIRQNPNAKDIDKYTRQVQEKEQMLLLEKRQIDEYEESLLRKEQEEKFKKVAQEFNKIKSQKEKELLDLENKIENSNFTIDKLRREQDSLQNTVEQITSKLEQLRNEHQVSESIFSSKLEENEKKLNQLESKQKTREQEIFELESEKNSLISYIEIKKKDLLSIRDEVLSEEAKLANIKAEKQSSIERELTSIFGADILEPPIEENTNNNKVEEEVAYELKNDSEIELNEEQIFDSSAVDLQDEGLELTNDLNDVLITPSSSPEQTEKTQELEIQEFTKIEDVVQDINQNVISDQSAEEVLVQEKNSIDQEATLSEVEKESTRMLKRLAISRAEETIEKTAILDGADLKDRENFAQESLIEDDEKKGNVVTTILIIILIVIIAVIGWFISRIILGSN